MLCYRAVDTTADEEGGGRDEEYVSRMKENVRGVSKRVGHVSLWFK